MKAAPLLLACALASPLRAQDDGSVPYATRGYELLESPDISPLPHAPCSLVLVTEWSRPINNGGPFDRRKPAVQP